MRMSALTCAALAAAVLAVGASGAAAAEGDLAPSPPAPTPSHPIVVAERAIPVETLERWERAAARAGLRSRREARLQAAEHMIQSEWIRGEAALRGITVSREQVLRAFRAQRRQAFPRYRDFTRFLRQSGQTRADLLFRVRIDMYSARIRRQVLAGARGPVRQERRLDRFVREFRAYWQARTQCLPRYHVKHSCAPPDAG
jgi:hypothetical protein